MNYKYKCSNCGETVEKLYQNNNCKSCLAKSFQKLINFINFHREKKNAQKEV